MARPFLVAALSTSLTMCYSSTGGEGGSSWIGGRDRWVRLREQGANGATTDRWAYFFREAKNLDVVPEVLSQGPFREALEVARRTAFTPYEWEVYERSKMAEQDQRGALVVARREGLEEGQKSGKIEGKLEAILAIFAARGLALEETTRARIVSCSDAAALDRWLLLAVTAASAREVVDPG